MVVTRRPATLEIRVVQLFMALPSMWTVQAPQLPMPQPYLVPFSLKWSRSTHNSGVSSSPSYETVSLFISKEITRLLHSGISALQIEHIVNLESGAVASGETS